MQIHQAQVPFLKMPAAAMSREDLTSQKPPVLPLDQVRAARESRVEMLERAELKFSSYWLKAYSV